MWVPIGSTFLAYGMNLFSNHCSKQTSIIHPLGETENDVPTGPPVVQESLKCLALYIQKGSKYWPAAFPQKRTEKFCLVSSGSLEYECFWSDLKYIFSLHLHGWNPLSSQFHNKCGLCSISAEIYAGLKMS